MLAIKCKQLVILGRALDNVYNFNQSKAFES